MEIPGIPITRWPLETREVHHVSHLQLGQDQEGQCSLLLCNMGLGLKFLFAKLLSMKVGKLGFHIACCSFRHLEREKGEKKGGRSSLYVVDILLNSHFVRAWKETVGVDCAAWVFVTVDTHLGFILFWVCTMSSCCWPIYSYTFRGHVV